MNATVEWDMDFTKFVIEEAYDLAIKREQITGFAWCVDHVIPLQAKKVCGLHVWSNIQVIPAVLNIRKSNRLLFTNVGEWLYSTK